MKTLMGGTWYFRRIALCANVGCSLLQSTTMDADAVDAREDLSSLVCPICLAPLWRLPKCLPCGHLACFACLDRCFSTPTLESDDIATFGCLSCPVCRTITFHSPSSLPTVFAVAEAVSSQAIDWKDTESDDAQLTPLPLAQERLPEDNTRLHLQTLAKARYLQCVLRPALDIILAHAIREAGLGTRQLRLSAQVSNLVRHDWRELRHHLVDRAGASGVHFAADGRIVVVLFDGSPCTAESIAFEEVNDVSVLCIMAIWSVVVFAVGAFIVSTSRV